MLKLFLNPEPSNHVLQFWLNKPNVDGQKGRIQGNLYGNKGMKEFYQSERVFLSNDFNTGPDISPIKSLAYHCRILEQRNLESDSALRVPYHAGIGNRLPQKVIFILYWKHRIVSYLQMAARNILRFGSKQIKKVKVPIGKWFTLEYYYKEGNAQNGKVLHDHSPDGGNKEVIYDLTAITHNTKDPNPDGVTDFNPIKLYTSRS